MYSFSSSYCLAPVVTPLIGDEDSVEIPSVEAVGESFENELVSY